MVTDLLSQNVLPEDQQLEVVLLKVRAGPESHAPCQSGIPILLVRHVPLINLATVARHRANVAATEPICRRESRKGGTNVRSIRR